jgi:dihydrodipicolinate synthase/N-acetylneuraminate lyase
MSSSYQPKGIYSAQWIPVAADGQVDRARLAAHLDFERRAGVRGVLALGSTGEFPFFSVEERKRVLATIVELAPDLQVLANISDIRPQAAIDVGRFARSHGVPMVGLMPPMFFPVSQADVLAYFLHVSDKVGLPVMLYNFPELAGKRIDIDTIAAFADRAPMAAIKQSGGEFAYHKELIALGKEKNFVVMSGADTRLPEVFGLGAAGCIGGLVNIVPELMVQIYNACQAGRVADTTETAARMVELGKIIDQLTFPPNVAAGLKARGFEPGVPKWVLSAESKAIYDKIVRELSELFARWGLAPASAAA